MSFKLRTKASGQGRHVKHKAETDHYSHMIRSSLSSPPLGQVLGLPIMDEVPSEPQRGYSGR